MFGLIIRSLLKQLTDMRVFDGHNKAIGIKDIH